MLNLPGEERPETGTLSLCYEIHDIFEHFKRVMGQQATESEDK